ncbi:MAG: hypothetical protein RLZZ367_678 [Bacteroidota bacterium]|jgi:hypothetical protein
MRPAILLFIISCCVLLFGFKQQGNIAPDDKVFLDIVATHDKLPLFNYTVKMAAIDTRPYNPNDPKVFPPTTLFLSRSTDTATHGGKMFRLRAKSDNSYAYELAQPEGQILYLSTYLNYTTTHNSPGDGKALRTGDSLYMVPGTKGPDYVIYKSNSTTYPTDSGWVYAIISADGKKVLQKGLIAGCMSCHSHTRTDKILGAK